MQLVCNASGVVKYAFKDTEILRWEGGHLSFPVRALDIKQDTHDIITVDGVPADYKNGLYKYVNNKWSYARDFTEDEINEVKTKKVDEFKVNRDDEIFSPYNNVQVDTPRSREDVQGAIQMWEVLGNPASITWTMADNTERAMTKAGLEAVLVGYATRKMTTFAKYQALKTQVDSATTIEELEGIQW